MIELVDLCVEMQRRVIAVHEQSLTAAKTVAVGAQQNIHESNIAQKAAWDRWIALGTFRK